MTQVFLPERLGLDFVLRGPAGQGWDWEGTDSVLILAQNGPPTLVDPAALVAIASWAEYLRRRGRTIQVDQSLQSPYTWKVGLLRALAPSGGWEHDVSAHPDYFPLCRVMGENHIPEIASSASITLRIVSDQASLALGSAVREILQNAEDHSESEEPTLFAAGYFRTSRRVTFAVADTGIGIRATLFRKGILLPEEDDGKAIVKAIQPRVTGAGVRGNPQAPNNAGLGLHTTRMFAQDCRGEMFVWSGSNYFRERGRGHSEVTAAPRWRGTLVYVSLYPDQAGAFPLRPRAIGSSDTIEIHFGRGPENSVLFKPPVDAVV